MFLRRESRDRDICFCDETETFVFETRQTFVFEIRPRHLFFETRPRHLFFETRPENIEVHLEPVSRDVFTLNTNLREDNDNNDDAYSVVEHKLLPFVLCPSGFQDQQIVRPNLSTSFVSKGDYC